MQTDTKKRVGILRGGAGEHYYSSLKRGGEIILFIQENLSDQYKPVDILVDQDYLWHLGGLPVTPSDLVSKVDVVWNTSHPSFSHILESLYIPTISASAFSFALENKKDSLRKHMKNIGLLMPRHIVSPKNAREIFEKFGSPWIVKIGNGIKVVKTFNELSEMINGKDNVVVEEFIPGKVASVHSVPGFRGEGVYTFPLGNSFGDFTEEEKQKIFQLAKDLHKHIDVKHYLKSDFVLNPRGKVYLLQIESVPDLKTDSHFSQVCDSVGVKMHQVLEHILRKSL